MQPLGVWTGLWLLWYIKLPGVADTASGLEEVPAFGSGQACVGPQRQHSDCGVHQSPGQCTLLSDVTTGPPSPTLEPAQTQVSLCHSHPGRTQSCDQYSLMTSFASRRVEALPSNSPADLESVRPGTGRSVRLTGIHSVVARPDRGTPLSTHALAHSWPRGLRKYAFPPVSLIAQMLCKVRKDEEQILLVALFWPNRTWFLELVLLSSIPPWCVPLRKDLLSQGKGTIWHPRPDLWNLHLWSLDATKRTPETLHPQWPTGRSVEPLKSVGFWALSMKMAFLIALTSVKRAGNLQVLSVNVLCMKFGPANSHIVLRTRLEYVPEVPTILIEQVVTVQAIPSQEGDPNLSCYAQSTFCTALCLFWWTAEGERCLQNRILHWIVDMIRIAYQARGLPCRLGVTATRPGTPLPQQPW
ncbi:hypothetical protein M9458_054173 [Cirrhinus mrigala]|uniref:Uncharacterized protein n=1 Tax=Cirrhinus mrigala TaxID=683832 RepID=A0ABD0MLQ3_CIRMR